MATKQPKQATPGNGKSNVSQFWQGVIANAVLSRASLLRKLQDPRRDYDDECGYPQTADVTAQDYKDLYDRHPIATRVVQIMPRESWKAGPTVYEDEDSDSVTEFEEAWDALCRGLRGRSWYQGEEGNPVWEALRRADELSGVGHYGLLLLGLDDGKPLSEPAGNLDDQGELNGKLGKGRRLLFLREFDESLVAIIATESNQASPRYGLPTAYNVTLQDPNLGGSGASGLTTQQVHWTRAIHLADNLGSSEIYGVPRMRPVLNRLLDLKKLYGPSAEMYYKGAFPGMSLETSPNLDVEIDTEGIGDQLEEYFNGLQRYFSLDKMTARMLSPTVVDPTGQIDVHLAAICIQLGIPRRIFEGSERGELASSQDAGSWNDRMRDRQSGYLTPRVIVPFVDRLIALGVLPEPEEYTVYWPDLAALSEQEKATVAVTKTDAMGKYLQGGVEALMTPMDYLTRVLEFSEEEAESILEAATEAVEEKQEQQAAMQEEQQAAQLELAKAAEQPPPTGQKPPPFGDKQQPQAGGPTSAKTESQ